MSFGQTLKDLLAQKDPPMTVRQFHSEMRRAGVRGVHGSYLTLRRWADGGGTPPDYYLEKAAHVLGVSAEVFTETKGKKKLPEAPRDPVSAPAGEGDEADPFKEEVGGEKEQRTRPWLSEKQVWEANSQTVQDHLAAIDDPAEISYIIEIEGRNPKYTKTKGRRGVLTFAEARLAAVSGEQEGSEEEQAEGEGETGFSQ